MGNGLNLCYILVQETKKIVLVYMFDEATHNLQIAAYETTRHKSLGQFLKITINQCSLVSLFIFQGDEIFIYIVLMTRIHSFKNKLQV